MLERIGDVLSQQAQNTEALTRYQGRGPVGAEQKLNRLKQLIAQIKQILNSLPPQICAMLAGVLAEAESILAAGGPPEAIGAMIAKLERIIAILMELLAELTSASGELNLEALIAFLGGLAAQLDASKKASLAKLIRGLRRAAAAGSLKGLDEASWEEGGFGDGTKPVEASPDNALRSLRGLIELALGPRAVAGAASARQQAVGD